LSLASLLAVLCWANSAAAESADPTARTVYLNGAAAVVVTDYESDYDVFRVYSVAIKPNSLASVQFQSFFLTRVSLTPSGIFVHPAFCPPSEAGSIIWWFQPDSSKFLPAGRLDDLVASVVENSREARVLSLQLPIQPNDIGVICISHVKKGTKVPLIEAVLLRKDENGIIDVSTSVLLSTERAYQLYLTRDRLVVVEFSSPAAVYRTRLQIYEFDGENIDLSSERLIGGCDLNESPELVTPHDYSVSTDEEFVYIVDQWSHDYRVLSLFDGTLFQDGEWQYIGPVEYSSQDVLGVAFATQ